MTIKFDYSPGLVGPRPGQGCWDTNNHILFTPPEKPLFQKRERVKPEGIEAVQLGVDNYAKFAEWAIQRSDLGIGIDKSRELIAVGVNVFRLGDWIVLEWEGEPARRKATFRHPTGEERELYGLNDGGTHV